jgi:hypothetical protein
MKTLKRTKVQYDIYGQVIEFDKPLYGRLKKLQEQITSIPDENRGVESEKVVVEFMIEVGFPKELLLQMEMEHILEIVDDLTGKKKD